MKPILNISDISFGKKYTIEVLSDEFKGSFNGESKFIDCVPECGVGNNMDFSFDFDGFDKYGDPIDDYCDIPEENIVVVSQEDINNNLVKIYEQ